MKCPVCSHGVARVKETREVGGNLRRRRECVSCGHLWTTLEVAKELVETKSACTLPQAISSPLFDLESALEKGVQDAVECVIEAIKPGSPCDRTKIDLAKWLIEDRRKWRIGIAEHAALTGQTPADPAVAQLAHILSLVPDPEGEVA